MNVQNNLVMKSWVSDGKTKLMYGANKCSSIKKINKGNGMIKDNNPGIDKFNNNPATSNSKYFGSKSLWNISRKD